MRLILAAAAFAALVGSAYAQDTTTTPATPAPPVPPSACGEFPPAPSAPASDASQRALTEAIAGYEAWRVGAEQNLNCRAEEYRGLQAQANARASEYEANRASGQAAGAAWTAVVEARNQRQRRN